MNRLNRVNILFFDLNYDKINEYRNVLTEINCESDKVKLNFYFYNLDLKTIMKKYVNKINGLVSPANSYGVMNGGIDTEIVKLYPNIQKKVFDKIKESTYTDSTNKHYIPVGMCEAVSLSNDLEQVLFICPTMFLPKDINHTSNVKLAFIGLLTKIKSAKLTDCSNITIACPCLGTGIGGMSGIESAKQILEACDIFYTSV